MGTHLDVGACQLQETRHDHSREVKETQKPRACFSHRLITHQFGSTSESCSCRHLDECCMRVGVRVRVVVLRGYGSGTTLVSRQNAPTDPIQRIIKKLMHHKSSQKILDTCFQRSHVLIRPPRELFKLCAWDLFLDLLRSNAVHASMRGTNSTSSLSTILSNF